MLDKVHLANTMLNTKTKMQYRHTCSGRYPASAGFSGSLDSCLRSNDELTGQQ